MDADELDWNRTLPEQWGCHGNHQLRARLDGLTDDEYFWSPVPGARSGRPGPRGLGEAGLLVSVGAMEPFPEPPMPGLVRHIDRELIHHLSEVCLMRDLYLHPKPDTNGATR